MHRYFHGLATILIALIAATSLAQAADYPVRPIRLVVASSPGGSLDAVARLLADEMAKSMGQPVVVDNKPGANGLIAGQQVTQAASDGYVVGFLAVTLTQMPEVAKSLQPVINVMNVPFLVYARSALPVQPGLPGFVQFLKRQPNITYGVNGQGSPMHYAFQSLGQALGAPMTGVPYKGGAEATMAVASGEVNVTVAGPQPGLAMVTDGRLKVLAVLGNKRTRLMPDAPALGELGLPLMAFDSWSGFFVPRGTPPEVVSRLNMEVAKAMKSGRLAREAPLLGVDMKEPNTPEQFAGQILEETAAWPKVVEKIKLD